ncbi:MAG: cytochrome c-type biogenesis protein [Gammaproteobacteria bacterium]
MNRFLSALFAVWLLCGTAPVPAAVTLEAFTFTTPAQEQQFKDLIVELRCLVCQNQSLLDSDAELAHDLRAEVYGMLQAGQSDDEIVAFLVKRYGDFVLYKPPVKPSTYLLWFGPFVLLGVALVLLLRAVRRQRQAPATEISATDRAHLDKLLAESSAQDRDSDA